MDSIKKSIHNFKFKGKDLYLNLGSSNPHIQDTRLIMKYKFIQKALDEI